MRRTAIHLSVGWRQRPMPIEDAVGRVLRMLAALRAIDQRFAQLLIGGNSPDPSKGWRPLPSSPEELTTLLRRSIAKGAGPALPLRWGFGAWNGERDDTHSVGLNVHVLGDGPPDRFNLRSFAEIDAGTNRLSDQETESIVRALVDTWDPDEATRTDVIDGKKSTSTYRRGEGWKPA